LTGRGRGKRGVCDGGGDDLMAMVMMMKRRKRRGACSMDARDVVDAGP
jgi:hypothetical protein